MPMHVIPVIDVRHGQVVRAVAGDRAAYRPLETPLAPSSDPVAVARGLMAIHPFDAFYVADLDGIEGRGRNAGLVRRLGEALPNAELWIDDGWAPSSGSKGERNAGTNIVPVIGSETLACFRDFDVWSSPPPNLPREGGGIPSSEPRWIFPRFDGDSPRILLDGVPPPLRGRLGGGESQAPDGKRHTRLILSLDFRGDAFLGPPELLAEPDFWPERVIVMTLARVGTGGGPDLARIADIAARAGGRQIYAAGGVRHMDDLRAARASGASGALVSTALHAGAIKAGDLERIAGL